MTIRKLAALVLCLALLVVLLSGCTQQTEHTTKRISALFPRYTLATATATAGEIVYGKVTAKSHATEVIEEVRYKMVDGERKQIVRGECYSTVTVEVIDCVKGGLEPGDTITYREYGGETARRTWIYEYTTPVSVGDTILFFKSGTGEDVLSPDLFWRVENPDSIYVSNDILPAGIPNPDTTRYHPVEMSLETFLNGIRAELNSVRTS